MSGEYREPLPWFPCYATELLADEDVSMMSAAEFGVFMLLRCRQWAQGSIPADRKKLSVLAKVTVEELDLIWESIGHRFEPLDGDASRLVDPTLHDEYLRSIEIRERQRANGSKGGRPRKVKTSSKTHGLATENPRQTHRKANNRTEPNNTGQDSLTRARARETTPREGTLIDPFDGFSHPDGLVLAFVLSVEQIPKFARWGLPEVDKVEKLMARLRDSAPSDTHIRMELGPWVTYNTGDKSKRKGGQKNPVGAFENWCANKSGRWALERDRMKNGSSGPKKVEAAEDFVDRLMGARQR